METQKNVRKKVPSEPILEDELASAKIKKGNYIAREVPGDEVPGCVFLGEQSCRTGVTVARRAGPL